MYPTSFEDFMRMLYEQFSGNSILRGNSLSSLTQPTERRMTQPSAPYGIPMSRMFGNLRPMPRVEDGPSPTVSPPRTSPSVGQNPINAPKMPTFNDNPFGQPQGRALGAPLGTGSVAPSISDEQAKRNRALDEEMRRRRMPNDQRYTMPVIRPGQPNRNPFRSAAEIRRAALSGRPNYRPRNPGDIKYTTHA